MKKHKNSSFFCVGAVWLVGFLIFTSFSTYSQTSVEAKFGKGIRIVAQDSSFALKFSTRFQTLYSGTLNTASDDYNDQLLIRRARLKFEGFAYSPKLEYKIELGLSNRDIGGRDLPQNNFADNIILDAVLKWNFYKNFELWVGQTKLPGNRERVVSSQKLQFVDRSILNSYFNIDRDIGIQLQHSFNIDNVVFRENFSISMGEGRNVTGTNAGGYDYTLRGEILPFGEFEGGGDYVGSDLEREESPKLAIGFSYDFNDRASREGGQTGRYLNGNRDLSTIFIDGMFKYKGSSLMFEYAHKEALDGPVVRSSDLNNEIELLQYFDTGSGFNIQYGYLFKNDFELAGRYSHVKPEDIVFENKHTEYTLGLSKYIVGHSLKIQSDISLVQEQSQDDELRFRLQIEMAL